MPTVAADAGSWRDNLSVVALVLLCLLVTLVMVGPGQTRGGLLRSVGSAFALGGVGLLI